MLAKQELHALQDDKGTVVLKNTVDCRAALELAQEANKSGGGRIGSGSGEMVMLGHIPPELWLCDPWLREARKAQRKGDKGEYTRLVKKFFELRPAFAIHTPKRVWSGVG